LITNARIESAIGSSWGEAAALSTIGGPRHNGGNGPSTLGQRAAVAVLG
jgi:hypothetical protein